ncbi:MAG: diaminopimelate epimerase [Myxococcaceae bacterium]|nr:diaminopimelate epimerase [Myxococcaceae bacterium]MCI0671087.1 diaminopimelate epimerase [Myxococcaceae bacterium]
MDRRASGEDIGPATARWLCDRRLGVGADGVLVLLPSDRAVARMVVHNADGSIAEMCGNGLRCAVKYLVDHAPAPRAHHIAVETGAGVLGCNVVYGPSGAEEVEVSMGPARLVDANLPDKVPFVAQELPGFPGVRGTAVSMGNPHLVLLDRPLEEAGTLGPELEKSPLFPARTNVEFVRQDADGLTVVVWERGCGLTRACGTGACAAVAACVHLGRLAPDAWHRARLPGGLLAIRVAAGLSEVRLRGPATLVFEAVVGLPAAH